MSPRAAQAWLAASLCTPSVLGTIWYQRHGLAGVPGDRALWLALLDVLPPLVAAAIALRPRAGARLARTYGLALAMLGTGWTWHPPARDGERTSARALTATAAATGAVQVLLAMRVRKDCRLQPTGEIAP